MKLVKLLSATAICLIASSLNTRAQSTIKIGEGSEIRVDSLAMLLTVDSLDKFNKKPRYNDNNQPVTIPNSYKPQQDPAIPMPVLKIPVHAPAPKKD